MVSLARELSTPPDTLRWEMPLAEVLRYRHASLFLAGFKLKRSGRVADLEKRKRRERLEQITARFRK